MSVELRRPPRARLPPRCCNSANNPPADHQPEAFCRRTTRAVLASLLATCSPLLRRSVPRAALRVCVRASLAMSSSAAPLSTVCWFRKGLRLHDNPSLLAALEGAGAVQPLFVLDPQFLAPQRVGAARLRFLLESLTDLDAGLRRRGSRLIVLHGAWFAA